MNRSDLLGLIPNGLSLARIGLAVAFPLVPEGLRPWVIVLAAATDAMDGLIARWLHSESDTGRLLDAIADKMFVVMLAGTLVAEDAIQVPWAVGIATRDLVVSAGAVAVAFLQGWRNLRQMRPTWLGKTTTAAQFAVLLAAVVWGGAPVWLLAVTTGLSVVSAANYVMAFVGNRNRKGNQPRPNET